MGLKRRIGKNVFQHLRLLRTSNVIWKRNSNLKVKIFGETDEKLIIPNFVFTHFLILTFKIQSL